MANRQNKIAKKNWKLSQMASLLAEALLKGEVSPFSYCLRDEAVTLFKRKFVYGKAMPFRRNPSNPKGKKVGSIGRRPIIRKEDGRYCLGK